MHLGWLAVPSKTSITPSTPKSSTQKSLRPETQNLAGRLRYRSFLPWGLDKDGKQLMRIDGRIWDGKTMREVSSKLSAQTTIYSRSTWSIWTKNTRGLITFNELHPGWRSSLMTAAVIIVAILRILLPEEMPAPSTLSARTPTFHRCFFADSFRLEWPVPTPHGVSAGPFVANSRRIARQF